MSAVLEAVGGFLQTLVDIMTVIVNGIVYLIVLVPKALQMLTYSIGFLPTPFVIFATAFILLSVIYFIIGR